ncbi:MAG: vWA domain-containing protein [Candidatus Merdivicinus sp.]|jgi:hypothetical protein
MYARKHRPMQKLTAICLSVSIAAASLLSSHVFASDQAEEPNVYLTGQSLLDHLRELGLDRVPENIDDLVPPEAILVSEISGESSVPTQNDVENSVGGNEVSESSETVESSEESSEVSESSEAVESSEESSEVSESSEAVESSEESSEVSESSEAVESSEENIEVPESSEPVETSEITEEDLESGFTVRHIRQEMTFSQNFVQNRTMVLNTENEVTVESEDTEELVPEPESSESSESSDVVSVSESSESSEPSDVVSEPESSENIESSEFPVDPVDPGFGVDPIDPDFGVDPSQPVEEIPDENVPMTTEEYALLVDYVQALEAEQIVSIDEESDITEEERGTLYGMLTADQFFQLDVYLNPREGIQSVLTPESLVKEESPINMIQRARSALFSMPLNRSVTVEEKDEPGLHTSKTATTTDGENITISMEAYVDGTIETSKESVPLDIVLVLDQSGSMEDPFTTEVAPDYVLWKGVWILTYWKTYDTIGWVDRPLYYKPDPSVEKYYQVNVWREWIEGSFIPPVAPHWQTYIEYVDENGNTHQIEEGWGPERIKNSYYVKEYREEVTTKLEALQASVNNFVSNVRSDAEENDVDHRIAIAGFASESGNGNNTEILTLPGDNTVVNGSDSKIGVAYDDLEQTDYQNALRNCTDSIIDKAVNSLAAYGATRSDLGMEMAMRILEENEPEEGRKQVVIMFTDGEPTISNQFSPSVANGAISNAEKIKDGGATVYTIGIFDGAKPFEENSEPYETNNVSDQKNAYMHGVSSNYPNASSYTNLGNSVNTPPKSYYLSAADAGELSKVFENISQEITKPSIDLGQDTVMKDTVSDYFEFPADFNATNVTVEVWSAGGQGNDPTWTKDTSHNLIPVYSKETKTVSLSGFDYAANMVGRDEAGNWRGKKVVLSFNVKRREGFIGGNAVPTNEQSSGVYKHGNELVETFPRPSVNVPIEYEMTANSQTIYLGNKAEVNNSYETPTFDWQDDFVEFGSPVWSKGGSEDFTNCAEHTVSVTIKPTEEPVEQDIENSMDGVQVTQSVMVHVLKPVLTFQDSYKTDVPAKLNADQMKAHWTNSNSIQWQDFNSSHESGDVVGDVPTVAMDFHVMDADSSKVTVADSMWTISETANFQISLTLTGDSSTPVICNVGDGDVQASGSFANPIKKFGVIPSCGQEGNLTGLSTDEIHHLEGRHFTVHLPSEFDLTIAKAEPNGYVTGETFRFTVTGPDNFQTQFTLGDTENGQGKWSVKLTGLKPGEYTIMEEQGWSWRYDCTGIEVTGANGEDEMDLSTGTVTATFSGGTAEKQVTFTNGNKTNQWLSWEDAIRNIFH